MSKIWYCRNCGYEVTSRGRCHSCHEKLTASALPELVPGNDDDEVGYRLDDWTDRDRGRLIEKLNHRAILHRFESDELVIDAEDEARVDDLVSEMSSTAVAADDDDEIGDVDDDESDDLLFEGDGVSINESGALLFSTEAPTGDEAKTAVDEAVRMLAAAAARLEADPTDMQADGDVAEASAGIFIADGHPRADEETWAAIGRVTRRLLAVLGAEEALETEIKSEAAVLRKLLEPLLGVEAKPASTAVKEQTVYEMSDWMPEQRAQLVLLLEGQGISYEWDGDDLLVPSDREEQVEALFAQIGGVDGDEGSDDDEGEERYQAVAELFAACGRLAADPSDPGRADAVLEWVHEVQGPPLLGMDEVAWFHIMSKSKTLVAVIDSVGPLDTVRDEANALHDLLRDVV